MSKKVFTGTRAGRGIGSGHGGNTPDMPTIVQLPVNEWVAKNTRGSKALNALVGQGSRFYRMGTEISIILTETPEFGFHLSIAHPKRYPTWDEVAYVRYSLIPNEVNMAMLLPPKGDYVNIHNNCFQLRQVFGKDHEAIRFVENE